MCTIFIYYFNLFIFHWPTEKIIDKTNTYAAKISKRIIDFELI